MVFSKLSAQEKDAFFGILDEYFQSRPELFNGQGQGVGISPAAAASSVVQRLAVPVKANVTSSSLSSSTGKSNNPYLSSIQLPSQVNETDVARAVTVGRVAAASLAFSGGGGGGRQSPLDVGLGGMGAGAGAAAPTLPRRGASTGANNSAAFTPAALLDPPRIAVVPGSEVDKLVTRKASLFSSGKKPEGAPAVSIPSAFVAPKNTFGPPPVRRSDAPPPVRRLAAPEPEPELEPEGELESEGEWAEALYDYSSQDPGDLAIKAGARVLVTEKTSDDWWTGQAEGEERQGLFPASYVKLL